MKISIKEFREIVREELQEMKLGVAGTRAPEPEDRRTKRAEDIGKMLLTFTDNAFGDQLKNSEKVGVETQNYQMTHGQDHDWEGDETPREALPQEYEDDPFKGFESGAMPTKKTDKSPKAKSFGQISLPEPVDESIAWLGEGEEDVVCIKNQDSEITLSDQHRELAGKRKEKASRPNSYIDHPADMSLAVNKEDLGEEPAWDYLDK